MIYYKEGSHPYITFTATDTDNPDLFHCIYGKNDFEPLSNFLPILSYLAALLLHKPAWVYSHSDFAVDAIPIYTEIARPGSHRIAAWSIRTNYV